MGWEEAHAGTERGNAWVGCVQCSALLCSAILSAVVQQGIVCGRGRYSKYLFRTMWYVHSRVVCSYYVRCRLLGLGGSKRTRGRQTKSHGLCLTHNTSIIPSLSSAPRSPLPLIRVGTAALFRRFGSCPIRAPCRDEAFADGRAAAAAAAAARALAYPRSAVPALSSQTEAQPQPCDL